MGTINTKGIVLMENNLGDYDKMITILTPGLGKIGCAAKGARRPKSLLMAGSQFLCFADYTLYKGNGTYNLNSCDTIEFFYNGKNYKITEDAIKKSQNAKNQAK